MASSDLSADFGGVDHPAPHRDRISSFIVFAGLVAAPVAWLIETTINYLVASVACFPHDVALAAPTNAGLWPVLICLVLGALAVSALGWFAAYTAWRHTRHEKAGSAQDTVEVGEGRTRFLALSGMFVSALFFAAALFDIPGLFLPACG
jgi:hypothetical protein